MRESHSTGQGDDAAMRRAKRKKQDGMVAHPYKWREIAWTVVRLARSTVHDKAWHRVEG